MVRTTLKQQRSPSIQKGIGSLGMRFCLFIIVLLLCSCSEQSENQELSTRDFGELTFAEHIAPIIHTNCTPCHRPGQAGPFSLMTYEDVKAASKMVVYMTQLRQMPPWPADTSYSRFLGERGLNEREIAMISTWVATGRKPGNLENIPSLPEYPEGSMLGTPDHVVWLPDTLALKQGMPDQFLIAKAPFELPQDTFVRAIEFVPGNRELLHHMNGHLINYAPGAKADVFDGETYVDAETTTSIEAYNRMAIPNDDGTYPPLAPSVVNYLPMVTPTILPEGLGGYHFNKKGAFIMNTIHFGPNTKDTTDRSRFNLFFSPTPPERPMRELHIGTLGISDVIPPLVLQPEQKRTFRSSYQLTETISVATINPHMHLLGAEFLAYAVKPDLDTIPLIRINRWDFRWQYFYTFPKLLPIPKGSTIHVFGTFDNTSENVHNPYKPPRRIVAPTDRNMRTTDEMFQFFINYLEHQPGDENISLSQPKD